MLKLGELFFRFRNYTPLPFLAYLFLYGKGTHGFVSLAVGALFVLLGESIRLYGVAHIGGVSRTRSFSTSQRLIKSGPFLYVRNPLYIGNLLLSGGLIVTANVNPYFTALFFLFFFVQYVPIVHWEENNLKERFGREFEKYRRTTPRWFPSLARRAKTEETIRGDYATALRSERSTLAAVVCLYLLILWRSGWIEYWFPDLLRL